MPIHRIAPNTSYPLPVSQVKKGRQDRRLLKPVHVASTWQENIAARVKPRSENRWRVSRAQPWPATLLQFLMLAEHLKSVVSLPEAPGRLAPPGLTRPIFSAKGNDKGRAPASDLPAELTLQQAASAGNADSAAAQRLASELSTLEQTLLAGTSFDRSGNNTQTARHVRQAPAPSRRIRHAQHRHIGNPIPSGAAADSTHSTLSISSAGTEQSQPATARPRDFTMLLDTLDPALLPAYLKAQGYAEVGEQPGCGQSATVLTALHQHLGPARRFIGDPASLDRLDSNALKDMMRHVAQENDFYGAHDGEQSAPEFQRQLLIRLVSRWAAGCDPTAHKSTGDAWFHAVKRNDTIAHIRQAEQSRLQGAGLTADVAKWVAGMLWADVEPTVVRTDTPGDLRYGSLEWTDLQIGIDTARMSGLDHWVMTYAELVALAQTGDMTARQDPDAAAGLLTAQVRAALVFAGISIQLDDMDAETHIRQAMTALTAARTARWEAAQQRLEALQPLYAPIPTRSQLAEHILLDHGIHPDQTFRTPPLSGVPAVGGHVESVTDTALNLYLDGRRSLNGARLPDVNQRFDASFDQYKANYQLGLKALYDQAAQALPEQDRLFWQTGQAQILEPSVFALAYPSSPTYPPPGLKPFATIIAITHEGQTRHYIASTSAENGQLIRFFAEDLPHRADNSVNLAMLDRVLAHHVGDLFTSGDGIKTAQHRQWHLAPKGAPGLAASRVAEYFIGTVEKQRPQAYAPTANQQALQRMRNGMLSLIPLYNCVTEAQAGDTGSAVLSCTLDVVSLIPVAGTALKVGVGAAKLTVQVSTSVLRQLAQTSAKVLLSEQALRTAVAEIARTVPLATSFARSGSRALAWDAANLLDPGFQLVGSVGKGVLRGGRALLNSLRQLPGLETLADRISTSLKRNPFHFDARAGIWQVHTDAVARRDGRQFVQIGERELEVIDIGKNKHVPVVRTGAGEDARFILVDPRSGLPYGAQCVATLSGLEQLRDYRIHLKGQVPDPDGRGIIHFKQRDYIQIDGKHYPVRYDQDWKTWRIIKENNPTGYPVPVRYDAGQDKWNVHSDIGLRGGTPPEPISFEELPDDIISAIARYLPGEDIERIRQVNRRLATLFTQESQRIRLTAEALTVTRLPGFQALLGRPDDGIAVIRGLRASLQAGPLTALSNRIEALPGGMIVLPGAQRAEAFDLIHEALRALPPQHRGQPLTALANQIHSLAGTQRMAEYQRIFGAAIRLDQRHRALPLAALAGQNDWLMELKQRTDAFNDIIRETLLLDPPHRAAPLAALSTQVRFRSDAEQWTAYDAVFDLIDTVPPNRRAAPLAAQAEQIAYLRGAERQAAFNRIIGEIPALPLNEREVLLTALWEQAEHLEPDLWPAAFDDILCVTALLPDEARSVRLAALAAELQHLPELRRGDIFDNIVEQTLALDLQHRAAPLTALVDELEWLPNDAMPAAFRGLCDAADDLDANRGAELAAQLAGRIDWLPDEALLAAYQRVFGISVGLPVRHRPIPLAAAIEQIQWLPEPDRMSLFRQAMSETLATDQQYRAMPFTALVGQFEFLPEGRLDMFIRMVRGSQVMLTAQQRAEVLPMLAARLRYIMPSGYRLEAVKVLLRETYMLPAADRAATLSAIARRIYLIEGEANRASVFSDVLPAIERLPRQHRAKPLRALQDPLLWLPANRRATADRDIQSALARSADATGMGDGMP